MNPSVNNHISLGQLNKMFFPKLSHGQFSTDDYFTTYMSIRLRKKYIENGRNKPLPSLLDMLKEKTKDGNQGRITNKTVTKITILLEMGRTILDQFEGGKEKLSAIFAQFEKDLDHYFSILKLRLHSEPEETKFFNYCASFLPVLIKKSKSNGKEDDDPPKSLQLMFIYKYFGELIKEIAYSMILLSCFKQENELETWYNIFECCTKFLQKVWFIIRDANQYQEIMSHKLIKSLAKMPPSAIFFLADTRKQEVSQ